MKILFVCLGNICRSPVLAAVVAEHARRANLDWTIESAGTGDWHVGEGADPRTVASAQRRGYALAAHRARQLHRDDFRRYDALLAADAANLREIERRRPADATAQVALALEFAGVASPREVPDPYYGSAAGFEQVIDLAEHVARALLAKHAARA
ncbi:low molecular weight protein-tyrosine-phosphatase [Tahibacter soli]|uniref:protein-tyrosine-phosphatase n=1 Tax=Tahibacter soli TaxID=2983605 RepID=A0A9X3YIP8_9GAMM|nr:low molecular weight protein-tyrosine-phosphatase [Tahibacter soli]MDC8012347.1 low molecular weight phosphotyrosine protein phosphatase [Tahibacter soli]